MKHLQDLAIEAGLAPLAEAIARQSDVLPNPANDTPSIDDNEMACLLEGSLSVSERDELLARIALSPVDMRILAMSLADLAAESELNTATLPQEDAEAVVVPFPRRVLMPALALAAVLVVGFLLIPRGDQSPGKMLAEFDEPASSRGMSVTSRDLGSVEMDMGLGKLLANMDRQSDDENLAALTGLLASRGIDIANQGIKALAMAAPYKAAKSSNLLAGTKSYKELLVLRQEGDQLVLEVKRVAIDTDR